MPGRAALTVLPSLAGEFRRYKALAERAIDQVGEDDALTTVLSSDGNSIAVVVWHISGNLRSRFTDFLTTDGEKAWRQRDSEFETRAVTRAALLAKWNEGWAILFAALGQITEGDLDRRVSIRGEEMSVLQALHRSLAHASYHVGQIVLIAKTLRGQGWQSLSIPKANSFRNE